MPAVSKKQERFMQAVAHSPKFAKKVGVPQSVGREFTKKEGGEMKESKKMMAKEVAFMKKKGAPKSMIKHEKAEYGMKKGGYAMGGPLGAKPSGLSYPQKTPKPPKGGPNVDTFPPSKSKPSGVGGMLNSLNKLSQNASGRVMPPKAGPNVDRFPVKPTPSVGSGRGPIKPLPPGSGRGFPVKPAKKMQSGGKADAPAPTPAPRVSMPSVEIAGGELKPAKIGSGYGVRWTKKFAGGGYAGSNIGSISSGLRRGSGAGGIQKEESPQRRQAEKMKSGGLAGGHKAADGIAKKGRTQTKMVKMMGGGKC